MIGLKQADTVKRLKSLRRERNRKPASELEQAALELTRAPSYRGVTKLLQTCRSAPKVRAFRPQVLQLVINALDELAGDAKLSPAEADRRSRERSRHRPRRLPTRGIGSTLPLKGLECDYAVILNAESLSPKNLYVTLTRGELSLTVCTETTMLNPH